MAKQVLVIGELNVDLILNNIDGFPKIGKEILSDDLTLTLGSSSAIFASNLSAQGIDVSFLGMIGDDQFGDLVIKSLSQNNVNTNEIIISDAHKTGVTVILNYDMDRAMVTYPGAMEKLSSQHIKKLDLTRFSHVHISSIFLQPALKKDIEEILIYLKEKDLTVSMDPQWDPAEKWDLDLKTILPLLDVFLPNEVELLSLTKCNGIEKAIATLNDGYKTIAIKQGERGAIGKERNKEPIFSPSYLNNNVVDCIGAGDSFDSGFIYAYLNNNTLSDCLKTGNIMGSTSTTAPGGTEAFKDFAKAKKIMKDNFNYSFN